MEILILHPDDLTRFHWVRVLAFRAASHFDLPLKVFEPKRRPLGDGAGGVCYVNEGRCAVVFRYKNHATDGGRWFPDPISFAWILETTAHELAHLRHPNHSPLHKALTAVIWGYLNEQQQHEETVHAEQLSID